MVSNTPQPWHTPPARLSALALVAESCRAAFIGTARNSRWHPNGGSYAEAAKRDLTRLDSVPKTSDVLTGFNLVSEVIVTYLEVAAGHFGGLAALYRSGEAMFPPLPLARSIIELCAHVMWVLGDGSGTPADILARAYLEEFTSCEHAKMAASRMASKEAGSFIRARDRWTLVRDRAIAAFPGTTPDDLSESKPGRTLNGQLLPGPEACVAWMFRLLLKEGAGGYTERHALGIYEYLSSGTHPSVYQARQLRVPAHQGDGDGTDLRIEIRFLEQLLAVVIYAFYNALSYVIDFYGLERVEHDALTATIDEVLPGLLT